MSKHNWKVIGNLLDVELSPCEADVHKLVLKNVQTKDVQNFP